MENIKWIRLADALPPHGERVLVYPKDGGVIVISRLSRGVADVFCWEDDDGCTFNLNTILAWVRLPVYYGGHVHSETVRAACLAAINWNPQGPFLRRMQEERVKKEEERKTQGHSNFSYCPGCKTRWFMVFNDTGCPECGYVR